MHEASQPTHVAWADESHHNVGRYRAVGLLTTELQHADAIRTELKQIVTDSGMREFAYKELKDARARFAAEKLIDYAIEQIRQERIRIDILIWDTHDTRHKIKGRDDNANLQRLYYRIFENVLHNRWPPQSRWCLYPDEQSAIQWQVLEDILRNRGSRTTPQRILPTEEATWQWLKDFLIHEISPCRSHEEQPIQLVDLFAGLGVYSYTERTTLAEWQKRNSNQLGFPDDMFATDSTTENLSRTDNERCYIISYLLEARDKKGFSNPQLTKEGLQTFGPKNRLNYWFYVPQHDKDKAPLKNQQ